MVIVERVLKVAPALCLDLDGTVRRSKSGAEFIAGPEDVEVFPDVEAKLWEYRDKGFLILGVSNQGGVAHGFKTSARSRAEVEATAAAFTRNPFQLVKCCFHDARGKVEPYAHRSLLRKPSYGMLAIAEQDFFAAGYVVEWDRSLFVGDRQEDRECALGAGIAFEWAWEFFGRPAPN